MRHLIFKHAVGSKDTGKTFPQIQKMSSNYNYDSLDSIHSLSRYVKKFPDFTPNLDFLILSKASKLTDLLSLSLIGNNGFLISAKLKKILLNYKLPKHKYYKAKISYKNEIIENYYWLHIISDYTQFVNYKKSDFIVIKNYSEFVSNIEITSLKDYFVKKDELKIKNNTLSIWTKIIILNNMFDKNLNLFKISCFDNKFYINETLNEDIVKNKITGVETSFAPISF